MRNSTDALPNQRQPASFLRNGLRPFLLFVALTLASRTPAARAETFNVACDAAALASVITTVNTNLEEDFVWLAPSCLYRLAASWVVQEDGGNPVHVQGRNTTISGQNARTAFIVNAGATLHLSDVTVQDGFNTLNGGAIQNGGTLTLNRSTVTASSASSYGGGIHNTGTARLTRSTVSANSAGTQAGGINNGAGSRLTLVDTTVSGNNGLYGGGIANRGTASLFNSTLFGNSGFIGGGILNSGASAAALLSNVTISGNTISGSNGGGGIRNEAALRLDNSIIANHQQGDCYNSGTITPVTSNLIEDGSCSVLAAFTGDPKLGSPVSKPAVLPLQAGSPAIDAGQNPACARYDQRGAVRPQDGNQDGLAICDLGSYEWTSRACGLLGIEVFAVLPLARLVARTRSRRRARRSGTILA